MVLLAGNHELMNLAGDLRYVAPGELAWLRRNATRAASAGEHSCSCSACPRVQVRRTGDALKLSRFCPWRATQGA